MPDSRRTFRDPAGEIAWQRQLRDRYKEEGRPPVPHLDVGRARIRPVTRDLAKQIIIKYEWLGTMSNTSHHYGIFFGPYCAGVTCVAVATGTGGTNVPKMFGLEPQELATLARGACVHWAPKGSNSKLVSWTCRLLQKHTNAKLIIAYADTDAGEIGTIYQASNWVCIGKGSSTTQYVAPNGRIYDQRNISHWANKGGCSWAEQKQAILDAGWEENPTNPKYRYVRVLDKSDERLVRLVDSMRVPYPKREDVF